MTSAAVADIRVPAERGGPVGGLWLPLACALALMLCAFSMPGREPPSSFAAIDPIALAKLVIRLAALGLLAVRLALSWGHPRCQAVLSLLFPFAPFVAWAMASFVWSALPAVSVGQSMGLLTLLLLAANVALSWRDERDTSALLLVLSIGLLVVSAVAAAAHVLFPDTMALNRGELVTEGHTGIVHPSAAGSTAAMGVVVLVASLLLWGWPWARLLVLPAGFIHVCVLVFAASRTPSSVGAALVLLMLCTFVSRPVVMTLLMAVSVAGLGYLLVDPGGEVVERASSVALDRFNRGEPPDDDLSGRSQLWEIVWTDFLASPWVGNGYYVTTRKGSTDVWGESTNLSAHNLPLQILATTGLIGAALFVAALGYWLVVLGGRLWARPDSRHLRLVAVLCGWNLGQGLFGEACMGGLYPEAVVAFSVLGVAVGASTFSHFLASRFLATHNPRVGEGGGA